MKKRLIEAMRVAFRAPAQPPPQTEESKQHLDRRVVKRLASGNIRLQRGEYSTREDIDREYERVKSHTFNDA